MLYEEKIINVENVCKKPQVKLETLSMNLSLKRK